MSELIDLTGQRFGRLTVIGRGTSYVYPETFSSKRKKRNKVTRWICRCDCGKTKEITSPALRKGRAKSCGCLAAEKASDRMKKMLDERWHKNEGKT